MVRRSIEDVLRIGLRFEACSVPGPHDIRVITFSNRDKLQFSDLLNFEEFSLSILIFNMDFVTGD
jgi:hypothetical protein